MEAQTFKKTTNLPENLKISEMLGNQYFMARKYAEAAKILESVSKQDPKNKPARCKLVICYTQIGDIKKPLELFVPLMKEDTDLLTKMDPVQDDCPCLDLVYELEDKVDENKNSLDFLVMLGMLSLYCDLKKSIKYFSFAQELDKNNSVIRDVLSHLRSCLERAD